MYLMVLDDLQVPHSIFNWIQMLTNTDPLLTNSIHLNEAFKQEMDKIMKARVFKLAHEATPWINSFVLVEGKDRLGNL